MNMHTHTWAHTSWGNVRVSIHSAESRCTPGDSPGWWCWLRSWCRGGGRGPQLCPSGSAQPAHSSSYSSGVKAGMSRHVRDHCLKDGLLVWLKRPLRPDEVLRSVPKLVLPCQICMSTYDSCLIILVVLIQIFLILDNAVFREAS